MGAYLQGVVVDQIISSDLHRTQQTAAILQHYLNTPLETTPLIREWHVGTLDGKPAQALFDAVAESGLVLEEFQPEGGERLVDVSMRAAQFLASLEDRSRCSLVICSHGDFLRMLLGKMLNQTIEAANRQQFANASLTVVEQDYTGSWALKLLNFSV
jgi:broad specificity phosphatase PhoE